MEAISSEGILKGLVLATANDISMLNEIGILLINSKKYISAKEIYERILKLDINYIYAWRQKGYILVKLGRYDEAIVCFDEAIKLNKKYAIAWADKGAVFGLLGKYNESIKFIDNAIKLDESIISAWISKGATFARLERYNDAIKFFDQALEIDPKNTLARFNKGLALFYLKKYEESINVFDEAIQLDSDDEKLWLGKASALSGIENYEGELKCLDKSISINHSCIIAWYNKGGTLATLGNYDNAIECFDNVINIDPNYPEAYANKGVILFERHRYDEAEINFKIALDIFSSRGMKEEVDKLKEYLVTNEICRELINKMKSLDELFLKSLKSNSIEILKKEILSVLKTFEKAFEGFDEKEIPADIVNLLKSKEGCLSALSNALEFKTVDSNKLSDARETFKKWNVDEYILEVNSIENFIINFKKYSIQQDPSHENEKKLLSILGNICILDEKFAEEISGKFHLTPYSAKLIGIDQGPEISVISMPRCIGNKNYIRIGLVQLDFKITGKFPYKLENKDLVMKKISNALDICSNEGANIICFPELSSSNELIEIAKKYKEMIIILGTFYKDNFNICPVIIKGQEHFVYKIHPSPNLENEIAPGKGLRAGNDIKIFESEDNKFRFVVLICIDYIEENRIYQNLREKNDDFFNIIINPCFNDDIDGFQKQADLLCKYYHIDTLQTNIMKYGGTCIIGLENRKMINRLISEGYRQDDSINYKLCEANGEMILIADLYLKGIEIPTHVRSEPRIKVHGRYIYEDGLWQKIESTWWTAS